MLAGLVGAAALWAIIGSSWIEPNLSSNADEHVYVQQAWNVAHGHLAVAAPAGHLAPEFQPWFAIWTHRGYVFKYNPVWPGVLAVGLLIHVPRLGLGVAAGLLVLGVYLLAEAVLGSRTRALLAAALVVLAPLTIIQSITLLPYIIFGGFWTLAAAFIIRGVRSRSVVELLAAGLLTGLAVSARPYDAVLVLSPFVIWACWSVLRRRGNTMPVWVIAAGALPFGVGQLAYDKIVTGDWRRLPFTLWSPIDKLGYGQRGLSPTGQPSEYFHIGQGVRGVVEHFIKLNGWSLGGVVLLAVGLYGYLHARNRDGANALAFVTVILPVGYAYYIGVRVIFSVFGIRYGPYYFLPLLVPVSIYAAEGLGELWARWRIAAALALCAMVAIAGVTLDRGLSLALSERDATARSYQLLDHIQRTPDNSLIFVPGEYIGHLIHGRFSRGLGPGTHTIYAVERQRNDSLALIESFSERKSYRLLPCDWIGGSPGGKLVPESGHRAGQLVNGHGVQVFPLQVMDGRRLTVQLGLPPSAPAVQTVIDVAAGTRRASFVSTAANRATTVTITITEDAITTSGALRSQERGSGPDNGLSIHVSNHEAGQPVTGYAWDAAAHIGAYGVSVLVPAVLTRYIERPVGADVITLCQAPPALDFSAAVS